MRKLSILLIALTASFTAQSQWAILPDGPYQDDHLSMVQFEEMNNNDLMLLFKTINDSLKMNKYANGTWIDVVPGAIDSDINYFKMIHNPQSDTLFIGYTKADGFYFRMYSSAGWTPEIHYSGFSGVIQVTLDENNNVPYFLVHSTNGESELISYSTSGDSLVIKFGPNNILPSPAFSNILYNPADNYVYISYTNNNYVPVIRRFNNVVWSIVDDQISPHTNPFMGSSYLVYNSITDSIEHRFIYHINSSRYYGYNVYNYNNNAKTEVVDITLIEDLDFSGYSVPLNDQVFLWDSEPQVLLCDNQFFTAPNDFPSTIYVRKGLFVDSNGSLILVDMIDRDIYKRDPFVLGEFEHELQSFPTVYPNPTQNSLQLDVTEEHELSIYNFSGEEVIAPQPYQPNQELDIQFLPAGLYILKLKNQSGIIHHQRFVVE